VSGGGAGRLGRVAAAGCLLGLAACSYHNVIYNAERLYEDAEAQRRLGRHDLARSGYLDVVRKTGDALRARPGSDWHPEALHLLGRAKLRLGELSAARAALEQVVAESLDQRTRDEALVCLAAIQAELGDSPTAMRLVNRALEGALGDGARAEAHLLRGRLMLERAYADHGWWDLDRAIEMDGRIRIEAGLERLRWGIAHDDHERGRRAIDGLLAHAEAAARADTIADLVLTARDHWGPAAAADLLAAVDEAKWDRAARGALALERARLLDEAGDTTSARAQAARVAAGLDDAAAEARLVLADWRVRRARDLAEVYAVRSLLLPAAADPEVALRLTALDELEAFASLGLDEPLGWFAAAEVARDRLGADYVARGLFLAYADAAPTEPWTSKALLAALQISPEEGDRQWLRGRLEAHANSPYVLAAHGGSAAGFEALEEELDLRLGELTGR
jgi:hypothetical protein